MTKQIQLFRIIYKLLHQSGLHGGLIGIWQPIWSLPNYIYRTWKHKENYSLLVHYLVQIIPAVKQCHFMQAIFRGRDRETCQSWGNEESLRKTCSRLHDTCDWGNMLPYRMTYSHDNAGVALGQISHCPSVVQPKLRVEYTKTSLVKPEDEFTDAYSFAGKKGIKCPNPGVQSL